MTDFNVLMGQRIQTARGHFLTREKLSELADISPRTLQSIEKGERGTTAENAAKICKALNLSADAILLGYKFEASDEVSVIMEMLKNMEPQAQKTAVAILKAYVGGIIETGNNTQE